MRIVLAVHLLLLIGLAAWFLTSRAGETPPAGATMPSVKHLEPLTALIAYRVHVTDGVVETIEGNTGSLQAAVLIHGDALINVDLDEACFTRISERSRTAVLLLPRPHVESARVDHSHSSVFNLSTSGLWRFLPTDAGRAELIDRAMRQAQHVVEAAANEDEVIDKARRRAESLIVSFFEDSMGWSVRVRWSDATDGQ